MERKKREVTNTRSRKTSLILQAQVSFPKSLLLADNAVFFDSYSIKKRS